MKLYGYWRSLATLRVRIAMNLKGLPVEEVPINLEAGEQHAAAYRAVNPQRVLPALVVDDGPPLFQSLAILEYLEERFPEPALLPGDPRGRARVRGIAAIVAADSHPLIVPRIREYLEHEFGISEPGRTAWIRHWIGTGLAAIEGHLADGATGVYCHGDAITIADVCLVSLVAGSNLFGGNLDTVPTVARIAERCLADDRVARAMPLRQPGAPSRS